MILLTAVPAAAWLSVQTCAERVLQRTQQAFSVLVQGFTALCSGAGISDLLCTADPIGSLQALPQ